MGLSRGFHGKRQRVADQPSRRQQIEQQIHQSTLLKSIVSKHEWNERDIKAVKLMLKGLDMEISDVRKLLKNVGERQDEIDEYMDYLDQDTRTLLSAEKHEKARGQNVARQRKHRKKKKKKKKKEKKKK